MREIRQIRQGDVLLIRRPAPAAAEIVRGADGEPLAGLRVPGERSGHVHVLLAAVMRAAGETLLRVDSPREMAVIDARSGEPARHADGRLRHRPVTVPAGWWEPVEQRQYVPRARPRPRRRGEDD